MPAHRRPRRVRGGRPPLRNTRAVLLVVSVAAGAGAAAALARPATPPDHRESQVGLLAAEFSGGIGGAATATGVAPIAVSAPAQHDEVAQLAMTEKVRADRAAAQRQREHEASHPRVYAPVQGRITSNYGPRWGTTHYGLDIANRIGTPIVAPIAGVVLDAGPASGFGLWVRVRHDDGTITVYGHIDSYTVREGQRVEAGQVIAAVGNRGQSTGPHLHFEVWEPGGRKVDPLDWLRDRGVRIGDPEVVAMSVAHRRNAAPGMAAGVLWQQDETRQVSARRSVYLPAGAGYNRPVSTSPVAHFSPSARL